MKAEKATIPDEDIVVEAYPKVDGTCDIFVTEERRQGKRREEGHTRYYGFSSVEDLAFALYVYAKSKITPPKMEEYERTLDSVTENGVTKEASRKKEAFLPSEVYDFFILKEPKNENPECDWHKKRLPELAMYQTETTAGEKEVSLFLLEVKAPLSNAVTLCEFGRELPTISEELLCEHTRPFTIKELVSLL